MTAVQPQIGEDDLGHASPSEEPIEQPALIMRSINDPSVPRVHAARLEALCRHHETLELDAETHFIWFGRAAEQVWQRRLAFLTPSRRRQDVTAAKPD